MWNRIIKTYLLSKRAFGSYKRSILYLTLLGFLNGFLAGIGINALIPIFSLITGKSDFLGTDIITRQIQALFIFLGIDFRVKYLLIFICLLFIIQSIVLLFSNYFIAVITANYERRMRDILFSKTVKADWSYLLEQKIGHLETVITNDIKYGTIVLNGVSGLVITLTSLSIYIIVAINISFKVTVFTFVFGVLYLILTKPLLTKTKKVGFKTSLMYKEVSHFINENVGGMKTIKIFSAENKVNEIAKKKFQILCDLRIKVAMLAAFSGSIMQPLSILFIGVVFSIFYKAPTFNIGAFLALVYLIQKIFSYFSQFQSILQKTIEAVPYLQSALSYEDKAREFKEKVGGERKFTPGKDLSFSKVNFTYNNNKQTLHNININFKQGEIIGLIGPSGAGKTTLVDLVLRLFQPSSGKILLGDIDADEINIKDWRDKIGYVSQDMFLMNDTIENNIRFHNDNLSFVEIELASRLANIYEFIMSKPNKFKTLVGEKGNLLSGGQRQRLIIARVMARKPSILILDEATNALDNESQQAIQDVIFKLKNHTTVIIVAHRLSTVKSCDKIFTINNGKVEESGTPDELLKCRNTYFARSFNLDK